MSLIKRKIHSLDPVEKQKKHRQVEYFTLIDKCLQIPNDDKLILRKALQDEDDSVVSLLEKYRKQGAMKDKDMRQLQIYLRKFIQRYKLDNPKYPTIKMSRGNCYQAQSAVKEYNKSHSNKRASLAFSVRMSKAEVNPNVQSHVQKSAKDGQKKCLENSVLTNSIKSQIMVMSKSKLTTPLKSPERENYFGITPKNFSKNSIKQSLKLITTYCKDEQKNYEQLIKKRKTQKLKIQANRVSVTIEKEHASPKKNNISSIGNINKLDRVKSRTQASFMINDSLMNISDSIHVPIQSAKKQTATRDAMKSINRSISMMNQSLVNHSIEVISSLEQPEVRNDGDELLQTISFKMKVDESEDVDVCQIPIVQMKTLSHQVSMDKLGEFMQMRRASNYNQSGANITDIEFKDVKKRLFDSSTEKFKLNEQQNEIKTPLLEIKYQSNKIKQKSSKCQEIKEKQLKDFSRGKENFNSGQKIQDIQPLKSSINQSLVRSQAKTISMENISQLSTINKQNEENNQVLSFYIKSQRNANDLSSQRLLEDSKAFVKSIIREKDEKSLKQSKSSRMQFSHRMEEIISGRTDKQQSQMASSVSNREKIKGANKLAFWARIQSTINE